MVRAMNGAMIRAMGRAMNRAMDGGDGQCDGMDGLIKRGLRTKDEGRARTVL